MRFDPSAGRPAVLKPRPRAAATPLSETAFDPNPGNLRLFGFVPPGLKPGAPLVVLLHGCGQTACGYAAGTGWDELAARHGFALIAAEQKAVNNPHTCFNWFNPEDIARDSGEAASIAAMVRQTVQEHRLDPARVFITGLSAGGAMTAAMLALYPELFAGGAILAGLPFGAAANVRDALDAMRLPPMRTPSQWGDRVRAATPGRTDWPRLSIWHGDLDTTVNILNAQALAAQWADLHGLALTDAHQDLSGGTVRLSWGDKLEVITVPGLMHGAPIASADVGQSAPYILDVGVSSASRIARFWGLAEGDAAPKPAVPPERPRQALPKIEDVLSPRHAPQLDRRIDGVIRRALRAAGLLKED